MHIVCLSVEYYFVYLLALLVLDDLAVLAGLCLAVGGLLHLAGEGVGHLGRGLGLGLVVPGENIHVVYVYISTHRYICYVVTRSPACPCT